MNTTTPTEGELLSALQISDSFFPLGSYSLSFGMETMSQLGLLKSEKDVSTFLSVLLQQLSTLDCPAIRAVYSAARRNDLRLVASIDRKLASFKNVKEFSEASRRTGRAMIRIVRAFRKSKVVFVYSNLVESREVPGNYAIALAIACVALGISEESAVTLMLYTSAISVLGAGVRLGHVTHEQAQQILHRTKGEMTSCAKRSSSIPWRNMRAFSPMLDLMGMQHVYLQSRMFSC